MLAVGYGLVAELVDGPKNEMCVEDSAGSQVEVVSGFCL